MRVISVNVGRPQVVDWHGRQVSTAIFKSPVAGPVPVQADNLVGDEQADLSVHGGPYKAIYAYPAEHYGYWRAELPDVELSWGMFGENLTVEGLAEQDLLVGDIFAVGSALLRVSEPRVPCYKLGLRFNDAQMVKRFLHSRRSGFYFSIAQAGTIEAGDSISLVQRAADSVSIADMFRVYGFEPDDLATFKRMAALPELSDAWRSFAMQKIAKG
jgi:MOSC domain-containing protein YiiM